MLIKIPNRIFFFFCSPLIIFSPRYYAAILRISVNMGGFQQSYKIHGDNKVKFPLKKTKNEILINLIILLSSYLISNKLIKLFI